MSLNLNLGLARQISSVLGIDPQKLAQTEGRNLLRTRMEARIPAIAADMREDGWVIGSIHTEAAVVRDALYRLWRAIFAFKGGGHLADLVRDSHDDKVVAELAAPVTAETPLEEVVRLTMEATLELAF